MHAVAGAERHRHGPVRLRQLARSRAGARQRRGRRALRGEGLEARLALKLRIVNPNDAAITYDGLSVSLDVRGQHFASGVSNERGEVPRFGEALITVPVSVSALSLVRQALDVARGGSPRIDYVLKGRLAGTALGSVGFSSQGEIDLPAEWARR